MRSAFDSNTAAIVKTKVWERMELDNEVRRNDPNTWTQERIGIADGWAPNLGPPWSNAYTPRLRNAFDQLMGKGKWEESSLGLGWWVISFPGFWDDALDQDSTLKWGAAGKWHVDGAHFQHFIDSKEVGLLPIFIFTTIGPRDGGTLLCPGSHQIVSQILNERKTQGDTIGMTGTEVSLETIKRCDVKNNFIEIQGNPGDVVLCHPFMLHARSMNCGTGLDRSVRPMCHPGIALKENLFVGTDSFLEAAGGVGEGSEMKELSCVEKAIVDSL